MNFPRNIYMRPNNDGSVYWAVEEVLYKGVHGTCVFIHCSSEIENYCEKCTLFYDCNRLRAQGVQLLKKTHLIQ